MKKYAFITFSIIATGLVMYYFIGKGKAETDDNSQHLYFNSFIEDSVQSDEKYGLSIDSFIVDEGIIRKNEVLGDILTRNGVDFQTIVNISKKSRDSTFDMRRIRIGNTYHILRDEDSTAKYLVYDMNRFQYTIYSLDGTDTIWTGEHPIDTVIETASGSIESSLWNSLANNKKPPIIAVELSDIYAWSIDFFGLKLGDSYRIVYESLYIDGENVGVGKILASEFTHYDSTYSAYYYDRIQNYIDFQGNSLRKSFLKAPLNYRRISSHFTHSRYHPVLKIRRPHLGVDYAAPTGTPVVAIGDGKIIGRGYQRGGGNYIKVKHNDTYTTIYMHLSKFGKYKQGQTVKQGEVIGYVGSTGLSTGPHLDFRVYKNGKAMDPLKLESSPAKPLSDSLFNIFVATRDSLNNMMYRIDTERNCPSDQIDIITLKELENTNI
ncbi:MAG: peptidoglycan DD-metalloendopeptidase family protein [Bacteroidales bacterium]